MGYAELIHHRLLTLPPEKQAEVYDFVEFIATRSPVPAPLGDDQRRQRVLATLASARSVWPKLTTESGAKLAQAMRGEWGGRGWESQP
jgi:hypothetical protein